jgi:hypothetical protein
MRAKTPLIACLLALVVGAGPVAAARQAQGKRPRPSDIPPAEVVTDTAPNSLTVFNDYATPEQTFSSRRAVVHFVTLGIDAPPLNDDDENGVPDYVERVGDAADTAIAYYERRGFARIPSDSGGPDGRPDVYVSRFAPGYLGVALPTSDAEGGAFIAVSNNLDPSAGRSFCSLYGTVAHEVFHLVQFSYYAADAEPALPGWVLEGSAVAMESRVYSDLSDLATTLQLRHWFAAPERTIVSQTYGASLLWRDVDGRSPQLLGTYLRRLAASPGAAAGPALVSTYRHVTGKAFAGAFSDFALRAIGDYPAQLAPLRTLAPGTRAHRSVAPLAIHYLRLRVPRRGRYSVRLTFGARDAAARAAVGYQLESAVAGYPSQPGHIVPHISRGGRTLTFTIPSRLRQSERFAYPTLVVSNGAGRPISYSVSAR